MNHTFFKTFPLIISLFFNATLKGDNKTILYVLKKAQESNDSHLIVLKNKEINTTILNHISIKINENNGYKKALLIIKKYHKYPLINENETTQYRDALKHIISNLDKIIAEIRTATEFDLDQNYSTKTDSGYLEVAIARY